MELDPTNPQTIWNSVLSACAGLLSFITYRLYKDVDDKAVRTEVKQQFDAVDQRFDSHEQRLNAQGAAMATLLDRQDKQNQAMLLRQDEQHKQNTDRMDKLLSAISTRNQS